MIAIMKMRVILILLHLGLLAVVTGLDQRSDSELQSLYRSHVLSHFFSKEDNSFLNTLDSHDFEDDNTRKRSVVKSDDGLFYHEGPYVSHDKVVQQIQQEKYVAPLPKSVGSADISSVTSRPQENPYTYAVTATIVTPASPYHASPTPVPYHGSSTQTPYHASYSPSPYHHPTSPSPSYVSTTPVPYNSPSTPTPFYRVTTRSSYHSSPSYSGHSVTNSHVTYPLSPIPTHLPSFHQSSLTPYFSPNNNRIGHISLETHTLKATLPPFHHSTPTNRYKSNVQDPIFLSSPGPVHPQLLRQAPPFFFSSQPFKPAPLLDPSLFTTNFTSQIEISPQKTFNVRKPAIQFQDTPKIITRMQNVVDLNSKNFIPLFGDQFGKANVNQEQPRTSSNLDPFTTQENTISKDVQKQKFVLQPKSTFDIPQPTFVSEQTSTLFKKPRFLLKKPTKEETFISQQLSPKKSLAFLQQQQLPENTNEFSQFQSPFQISPEAPVVSNEQISFQPLQTQEFIQNLEPQNNQNQQSLFQSINQLAPERPVHKKITDPSKMKHMPKKDALQRLMDIAGDDWDVEIGIEKNLLDTSGKTDFICPSFEGHFPDPDKCSVYYQCSSGTPTKNTCQSGLQWNLLTNQCDWEANVDCSLNKSAGQLLHNV